MAIAEALMGLACVLTHAPTQEAADTYQQLNYDEKVQVVMLVESGACFSSEIQALIDNTENGAKVFLAGMPRTAPSHGTW